MSEQVKLFAKMAQVMAACRTLEKTGRNQYDKYDYVTADAIATKIGALLAQHKLVLLPSMIGVETSEYTTQKGGSNFRTVCHFQMTLACGDTGATWTSQWSGEAIDRSDKSISKAAVSAVKYFLLKTFLLAGGDEEDADASSPTIHQEVSFEKPEVASDDQIQELNALGLNFYGNGEWKVQSPKLAEAVSKGAVKTVEELTPKEAAKLIEGLRKRLAEVQVPASVIPR